MIGEHQDEEDFDESSACGSNVVVPKLGSVFCDTDTPRFLYDIVKIAGPSSLSAVLGQVTYFINLIVVAQTAEIKEIAGIGLGQALSQLFGIMIFLGLSSGLHSKLS